MSDVKRWLGGGPTYQLEVVAASDYDAVVTELAEQRKHNVALVDNRDEWIQSCGCWKERAVAAEAELRRRDEAAKGEFQTKLHEYAISCGGFPQHADKTPFRQAVLDAHEKVVKERDALRRVLAGGGEDPAYGKCGACGTEQACLSSGAHGYGKCVERRKGERRCCMSSCYGTRFVRDRRKAGA